MLIRSAVINKKEKGSLLPLTNLHREIAVNQTETMIDQIRRLNEEQAVEHERKRLEAINKIRLMRRAQREQQELNHKEKLYG